MNIKDLERRLESEVKFESWFFKSVMGDTIMICLTFIQSTRHSAYDSSNGHLRKSVPLLSAVPDQVQLTWSAVFDMMHTSPYHVPDVFNGEKVWAHCWSWHMIDVVLLEMSIDDSCMMSMGIVVLKNKMSTHTPSRRDDKLCQHVVLVVLVWYVMA